MKIVRDNERRAVSPVIATLLLIAIAVAAAIIVYAFVTGLIGGLSTGAGSSLVTITGSLSVPVGSGPGTLVMSVKNGASNPISGVVLTSLDSGGVNYYCHVVSVPNGCAAAPDPAFAFNYNGAPIAAGNALPVGSTGSAEAAYTPGNGAFSSGTTYTALITVTFSSGSINSYTYSITAQL